MRCKPDIKYNKKEEDIKRLSEIQQEILNTIAPLLKQDGLLVYSTCTVDPEENEYVVKDFLYNHPNYQLDQSFFNELPTELQKSKGVSEFGLQLFPQDFQTDGFFLTRLIRKS